MVPHHVQLIINGQKRLSGSGETFETYHPGTKEHIGHTESASRADIQDAIKAASVAFPAWEKVPAAEKRKVLNKAADILESKKYVQQFLESEAQEVGFNAVGGQIDAHAAAGQLREGEYLILSSSRPLSFKQNFSSCCSSDADQRRGVSLGKSPWCDRSYSKAPIRSGWFIAVLDLNLSRHEIPIGICHCALERSGYFGGQSHSNPACVWKHRGSQIVGSLSKNAWIIRRSHA